MKLDEMQRRLRVLAGACRRDADQQTDCCHGDTAAETLRLIADELLAFDRDLTVNDPALLAERRSV